MLQVVIPELLIENCPEDRLVVKEQGHRSSTDLIELAKSVELVGWLVFVCILTCSVSYFRPQILLKPMQLISYQW